MMKDMGWTLAKAGEYLPSLPSRTAAEPRCAIQGYRHVFVSKAAYDQHMLLCHPKKPGDQPRGSEKKVHKCTYNECGLTFPTYYQLMCQKNEQNHKITNKGRKAKR